MQTSMRCLLKAFCFALVGKTNKISFSMTIKQLTFSSRPLSHTIGNGQITRVSALIASTDLKSLVLGTGVHGQIIKLGCRNDTFIQNSLIRMYMKCGCLGNGLRVFDEMPERNLVSWTLIISGALQNGASEAGIWTFLQMRRNGFIPNEFALGSIIKICCIETSSGSQFHLEPFCLGIHSFSLKTAIDKNPFVGSSIMHMYAMFGTVEATKMVFDNLKNCNDIACWNVMIGAYAQNGAGFEALKTLSMMHFQGLQLDEFTFMNSLNGCSVLGDLEYGKQVHGLVITSGMDKGISMINSLMDMYFKSGGMDFGLRLFDRIIEKDVVSWNTVFGIFLQEVNVRKFDYLFQNFMDSGVKPNCISFSILFRVCGKLYDLYLGLQMYCLAFKFGYADQSYVASPIIYMFSRCEETTMARVVFDSVSFKNFDILNEMILGYNLTWDVEAVRLFSKIWHSGVEANDLTFSSATEACFNTGYPQLGRQIHGIIIKSGFSSNRNVCCSLIRGYIRVGLVQDSFEFFNVLKQLDLVCCSTMISALGNKGFNNEAIQFLNYTNRAGEKPDDFILSGIFTNCASLASYQLTTCVHSLSVKLGFDTFVSVASATIDAYSKCGDLESAALTFSRSSDSADVILFNSMIMAYARHGQVVEAMRIFDKMKVDNLQPTQSTFVSLISACGHMGLVDLGRSVFKSISSDFGITPSRDNYGCLVDLLSRYGQLEDAKCVIAAMPFPPWPAILRSFLNGCRVHGDKLLGQWAAKELTKLIPEDNAAYILMSRMHSEGGHWDDAVRVRKTMVGEVIEKPLGCSWIEL